MNDTSYGVGRGDHLAANARKEGVTVTDSGLRYEVINPGSGAKPRAESTVRTHYHDTLIDSSYDRGQPAEFPLKGVIAGHLFPEE